MYEGRVTEQFVRATRKLRAEDLKKALDEILKDPYNALGSHRIQHEWAGFRGARFTGADRIIYRICEECVRMHEESLHPLACCGRPDDSKLIVTFVDFGDYHASAGRKRVTPRMYDVMPAEPPADPRDSPP